MKDKLELNPAIDDLLKSDDSEDIKTAEGNTTCDVDSIIAFLEDLRATVEIIRTRKNSEWDGAVERYDSWFWRSSDLKISTRYMFDECMYIMSRLHTMETMNDDSISAW